MWARPDGAPMGGAMTLPKGMNVPPHWGMYVGVPKLEEGVAAVEKLGGSWMSPVIDVPTVGRMRTMKDPQGAMFSIYEPLNPPQEPEWEPKIGDVSWHELYTTDAEAAMKFYTTLFGWKPTESMDMGEMGKYHMFGRGFPLGGMMNKPPDGAGPARVEHVLPRRRRQRRRRPRESERRAGHQRPDGSAGRRLDCELHGSAGRGVLDASQEVAIGCSGSGSPGSGSPGASAQRTSDPALHICQHCRLEECGC